GRGTPPRVCERRGLDSPCGRRLETGRSDVTGRVTARLAGVEANRTTRLVRPGSVGYSPAADGRRGSERARWRGRGTPALLRLRRGHQRRPGSRPLTDPPVARARHLPVGDRPAADLARRLAQTRRG